MIALSQRALAAVNGRARADASTRRRAVRTNAWGTRSRAAERSSGLDEQYYEDMAWGDGATRFARGSTDEAESCPLELHAERAAVDLRGAQLDEFGQRRFQPRGVHRLTERLQRRRHADGSIDKFRVIHARGKIFHGWLMRGFGWEEC